jgi:hypothetical protein
MDGAALRIQDDRVLASSRWLAGFITPFLLLGFVLLYLLPGETHRLFAWTIRPTMTSMTLASAYLGGAYFFVRVLYETRWHVLGTGFLAVALFASLLGVATIVHWGVFNHRHPAFWVWAALYFAAPFLVMAAWLANRRHGGPTGTGERHLSIAVRAVVAAIGALALTQGVVMFLWPGWIIPIWPWALTPLTCRVVGSIFCLGSAGLSAVNDARWTSLKLMLQVEVVMIGLIFVGAVRARGQFDSARPLTWVLAVGLLGVLGGSAYLWFANDRPQRAAE